MAKRTVLYARVSTDDQDVTMQLDELRDYAAARKFEIIDEITDQISSGKKNRPGYAQVLELARKRKIDVILVWKFDRFARSTRELLDSLYEFRDLGVDFLSLQDNIDTTTPMGEAIFTIIAAIAQFERATIRTRVKSGMDKAKRHGTKSGLPIGRPRIDDKVIKNAKILRDKGIAPVEIQRRLGLSKASYYRIISG